MNERVRQEASPELLGRIRMVARTDADFPVGLTEHSRMPDRIYVLGELPDPNRRSVAIVGARGCSIYGKEEAIRFGRAMAEAGVQVLSGMAFGIDAWAAQGALEAGGRTFAVLGTGVDVCYPKENYPLYRRIIREGGGVLSEFPPGSEPAAWHFPIRNRIISAMADLVLVVEARVKSGSLITAGYALEQGKSIYAVPGRTGDALSEGCNRLIAEGAGIAYAPGVLLDELGLGDPKRPGQPVSRPKLKEEEAAAVLREVQSDRNRIPKKKGLPKKWEHADDYQKIWKAMEPDGGNIHTLLDRSGLSLGALTGVLTQLCISG
ncbi:MAG: DNA-processing protein DprA [Eubacteriales bacterium]|nr:DNA-processing protein DprA [Eubacteriales bacterium]